MSIDLRVINSTKIHRGYKIDEVMSKILLQLDIFIASLRISADIPCCYGYVAHHGTRRVVRGLVDGEEPR